MSTPKAGAKLVWIGIGVIAAAAIVAGYLWTRQPAAEFTGAREPIRIGILRDVAVALLIVAQEKGFLQQAGLDVEAKPYPSGRRSMEAMFAGDVDIAVPTDTPIVIEAFARQDFRIIGTISTADRYQKIVARKDLGIQSPRDLKGKRVATQKDSAVHYFLHLFLANYGMSEADVKLSFLKAEDLPQALANGDIDAFSMREPFVSQAKQLGGDKVIVFDAPGLYTSTNNLVVMEAFARQKPEAIKRLLQALVKAQEFVGTHPEEARSVVAKWLAIPETAVASAWTDFDMRLTLTNVLLSGLRNGALWVMDSKITDKTAPPDFRKLMYLDGLRAVRPEAATISAN